MKSFVERWKEGDSRRMGRRLQGAIVPFTMPAMQRWIIEQWRGWFLTLWNLAECFRIGFEQGIHRLNHLSRHPPDDSEFAGSHACSFLIGAFALDQAFVEMCPFGFAA
jgi:hypothetical protein